MHSVFYWLSNSRILRRAAILLVVLAGNSLAWGDEIHEAAMNGDLARVKTLLKDRPDLVSSQDTNGDTPLHAAAFTGQMEVVEWLLANKADVKAKDKSGNSLYSWRWLEVTRIWPQC
jgi:ankyrin repeat protein